MTKPTLTKRLTRAVSPAVAALSSATPTVVVSTMASPACTIEIVICFDAACSMKSLINTLKARVIELTEHLFADIPGIRIGVLAHTDYGTDPLLQHLNLTSDATQICDFVRNVRYGGGKDMPHCYELALHEVRTSFSWTPGTRKRLIMIGDNLPHELGDDRNLRNLDWREEAKALKEELNLSIHSVQAFRHLRYQFFWKALAKLTDGKFLPLKSVSSIFDFIMAICYSEHDVDLFKVFEEELIQRSDDVCFMLCTLKPTSDSDDSDYSHDSDEDSLKPTGIAASLHRARHAPPKKKRAGGAKTTAARVGAASAVRTSRKRLRRPAAPRVLIESWSCVGGAGSAI